MNIAFIGYGNMAKAIAKGLMKEKAFKLYAASPSLSKGINAQGLVTDNNNQAIAEKADVLILAVKPAQIVPVLLQIQDQIKKDSLLISVAAGISLSCLKAHCPPNQAIVRTMPNTPAEIAEAATALIANAKTTPEQKQLTEQIFSNIGLFRWIEDESQLNTITALSGSGPAYVFKFMESMIQAAQQLGLDEDTATRFTLQTFKGAAELALQSEHSLSDLRKKVTSPKGTTAAALDILCQGELDEMILSAMTAAKKRSIELNH